MSDLPIIMTEDGAKPTPPKILLANLISRVAQDVPGYTANLPAGLITDLASTATGAVAQIDHARVDLINSVSPYGANIPMLKQLGNIYGVQQGQGTNTSVYETFMGPPGFVVQKGFTVSDGNHQYTVVHDTVIPTSGQTDPVYCLATMEGTWAVPAGSVTQIVTSVPESQPVTCTNLKDGLPGEGDQSYASYRGQVMGAGMFAVQGTPDCVRTALRAVKGVQENLITFRQAELGRWVVTVGGGDPIEVAHAIYQAVPDISILTNDVTNPSGLPVEKMTVPVTVYPDVYQVPYVIPGSQNVRAFIEWNTVGNTYVDPTAMQLAAQKPVSDYINDIATGQPINIYQIQDIFLESVKGLVPASMVSLIDVKIGINGVLAEPEPETNLVYGDTYGYFTTSPSQIEITKYGS